MSPDSPRQFALAPAAVREHSAPRFHVIACVGGEPGGLLLPVAQAM